MEKEIKSLEELEIFAKEYLAKLKPNDKATVLALFGDLGSGKTAFVKKLAKALGIEETIISPTFILMKSYAVKTTESGFKKLVHIDAYRIENEKEFEVLKWPELLKENSNLICLEWPEKIGEALPEEAIKINFKFVDENIRRIKI